MSDAPDQPPVPYSLSVLKNHPKNTNGVKVQLRNCTVYMHICTVYKFFSNCINCLKIKKVQDLLNYSQPTVFHHQ